MKTIFSFVLSAMASHLALTSTTANATYGQDYPATLCTPYIGGTGSTTPIINGDFQIANGSTSAEVVLLCPVISNGTTISAAGVWFYSNGYDSLSSGASINAEECSQASGGGSKTCNAALDVIQYSGGAGNTSASLNMGSPTPIFNIGSFNYIVVTLGETRSGIGNNTLLGYQLTTSGS